MNRMMTVISRNSLFCTVEFCSGLLLLAIALYKMSPDIAVFESVSSFLFSVLLPLFALAEIFKIKAIQNKLHESDLWLSYFYPAPSAPPAQLNLIPTFGL